MIRKQKIVVAMLKNEGHEVIGITLQLYDHGVALQKKRACCAGVDIYDAQMLAEKINIPHYVLNPAALRPTPIPRERLVSTGC